MFFSFMFFWFEPKEPKVQGKHQRSAGFAGPTHRKTLLFYTSFFYPEWKTEDSATLYAGATGGAAFSLIVFSITSLSESEKEALEVFLISARTQGLKLTTMVKTRTGASVVFTDTDQGGRTPGCEVEWCRRFYTDRKLHHL